MANGKLSVGDVEAAAAGTFDVDQSALANKVLHLVIATRFCGEALFQFWHFFVLMGNLKPIHSRQT